MGNSRNSDLLLSKSGPGVDVLPTPTVPSDGGSGNSVDAASPSDPEPAARRTSSGGGAGRKRPPKLVGGGGLDGPDGGESPGLGHSDNPRRGEHWSPDVAGRDLTWKRGGPDPTRELLQERLSRQATDSGAFEPVTFEAFVKKAVIVPGGEVEITLSVPKELKYAAIPLTDAAGFMVTIHAERTVGG